MLRPGITRIKRDRDESEPSDLNPLDYSIWDILEAHDSVDSLKQAIIEAFENLNQGMINRAVDDWMRRLDAVIAAEGGHFE